MLPPTVTDTNRLGLRAAGESEPDVGVPESEGDDGDSVSDDDESVSDDSVSDESASDDEDSVSDDSVSDDGDSAVPLPGDDGSISDGTSRVIVVAGALPSSTGASLLSSLDEPHPATRATATASTGRACNGPMRMGVSLSCLRSESHGSLCGMLVTLGRTLENGYGSNDVRRQGSRGACTLTRASVATVDTEGTPGEKRRWAHMTQGTIQSLGP